MKKLDWIDILLIILFLLAVYFILTRIFGNSASDLTIMFTLFGLLTTALYKLNREFGELSVKINNMDNNIKEGFNNIKKDIAQINKTKTI